MKPEPVRVWLVERVALGEAPPGYQLTPYEQHLAEELRRRNADELAALPPARVAAEVRRRALGSGSRRRGVASPARAASVPRSWAWTGAAVAAAMVLFVVSEPQMGPIEVPGARRAENSGTEVTRIKGRPALIAHRQTPRGAELLRSDDVVRAGDRVQLGVRVAEPVHAALVSIDGRGVTTLHVPKDVAAPPAELAPGTTSMPFSYELDDAPDFERFFLVTADAPFSTQAIQQAAEELAAEPAGIAARALLQLPPELEQVTLRLRKDDSL